MLTWVKISSIIQLINQQNLTAGGENVKEYMSVMEAANNLGVNHRTMYEICTLNNFPVLKIPTKKSVTYRINIAGFEQWIKTHSV